MLARIFGTAEPWSLVPLRIALGGIFLVHGGQKLFFLGVPRVAKFVGGLGFHPATPWAVLLIVVEILGGLAILVGFMTRWAALLLAIEMLIAINRVVLKTGFFTPRGWEFNMALVAACLTLLFAGAKRPSVDRGMPKEL